MMWVNKIAVHRVRFAIDPEGVMSGELVLCFYWHKCSAKA